MKKSEKSFHIAGTIGPWSQIELLFALGRVVFEISLVASFELQGSFTSFFRKSCPLDSATHVTERPCVCHKMVAEILDRINSSVIQSIQQSFKANKRQKKIQVTKNWSYIIQKKKQFFFHCFKNDDRYKPVKL